MLVLARHLHGVSVVASDGAAGRVVELLFDDQTWQVCDIVVETGAWWQSHEVLLSPERTERFDWADRRLAVCGTSKEVRELPLASTHLPVARRRMLESARVIAWEAYWSNPGDLYEEIPGDLHLRSTKMLPGIHLRGMDGSIGHLADFLIDDRTWAIRYLGIATRNWWPGRHVLIEPMWVESIDLETHQMDVSLPCERIEKCPPYNPSVPLEAEEELAVSGRREG